VNIWPGSNFLSAAHYRKGKVCEVIGRYKRAEGTYDLRTLATCTYDATGKLASIHDPENHHQRRL
jgi:hypothetical protein